MKNVCAWIFSPMQMLEQEQKKKKRGNKICSKTTLLHSVVMTGSGMK